MPSPLLKIPLQDGQSTELAPTESVETTPVQTEGLGSFEKEKPKEDFLHSLVCVIYECKRSMDLTFISNNILELIGFEAKELVGNRSLWEERIVAEDSGLVRQKLDDLKKLKSVSMVHRLLDRRGFPVWVSHGLQWVTSEDRDCFHGYLLGARNGTDVQGLGHGAVDLFVHRMGNHFQLLNLVISSLRKALPESRETEVLQETVDRVIELTRRFSEYNQAPSCWSEAVDMIVVLQGAVARRKPAFLEKGVVLEERIDASSIEQVSVSGDPFLLELAVGHVLQNALEATGAGGKVTLDAKAELEPGVVKVHITDSGCGIEEKNLGRISLPFFTTKEHHDGLGLSMAWRFIKMHSGLLDVRTVRDQGTEVKVVLPAVTAKKSLCK